MREFQHQSGGWDVVNPAVDRTAVNQRIATGHLRTSDWEVPMTFSTQGLDVKVGDVFQIFTTATLGTISSLGISVISAHEGFKAKLRSQNDYDLSKLVAKKIEFDETTGVYAEAEDTDMAALDDIGDSVYYATGYPEVPLDTFQNNTDLIGLEILELPEDGLMSEVVIELRISLVQPARPIANPSCCSLITKQEEEAESVERT